jgi:RNA polymerase sigma-70 factor (ECF subfamily)
MPQTSQDVTDLLNAWGGGSKTAFDRLVPLVYEELRRQASRYLRRERPGQTLQTTDLIHEAYIRLVDQKNEHWQSRAQFFGVAAQLMRRILVDRARARHRAKRGGADIRVSLNEGMAIVDSKDASLIVLDEALNRMSGAYVQESRIVELRFFGGLSVEETAEALGVSPRTVKRGWRFAKAWLRREIGEDGPHETAEMPVDNRSGTMSKRVKV